ncbi:histone-like nucleoid-structuring protein, MvaT/MvaU family [Phytopseudomonas seleniipraecipitans]|uniref:H-NS family protein MvaT n=1 Tax=Phytopseudomonas seleniipraecipitans TaxID=640205 RepID=A0A1G7RVG9_9GAMM|nr:histone-like nucleoid-structuring protein, MvaT/MvaU family [Pseudomonas seleniipraecipitans]SDG13770.1 H-NS family protein MvaT [Pseudomonas seleniipraecipitans]
MSKLAEFKALEAQIEEHKQRLAALQGDEGLQKEIEFESKLRKLLAEYNYSLPAVIALLDPAAAKGRKAAVAEKPVRRERALKRYKNPNTGEVVETKGGNHKVLKSWKEEHGSDIVESWTQ